MKRMESTLGVPGREGECCLAWPGPPKSGGVEETFTVQILWDRPLL